MRKMCKSARLVSEVVRLAEYGSGRLHYFMVACRFCFGGSVDNAVVCLWGQEEDNL